MDEKEAADFINFLKLTERLKTKSSERDELLAFYCKGCNIRFVPGKHQLIFHNLCDGCFDKFDNQKMSSRLSRLLGDGSIQGTESVDEWIKTLKIPEPN